MFFFGQHACLHALSNPNRHIINIFIDREEWISSIPAIHHKKIHHLSKKELDKKVPSHTHHQGLIVELSSLPQISNFEASDDPHQCVVVLDQVTDPHNVGAIIRSCVVFGVKAVIMLERHAPKESGVIAKSASGGLEHIPLIVSKNLGRAIDDLKDQNFWTFGLLEKGEKSLDQHDLKGRIALIMGSEGTGIRHKTKQLCDFYAYLPFSGAFSTLNVSNATAVALYEVQRQKNLTL